MAMAMIKCLYLFALVFYNKLYSFQGRLIVLLVLLMPWVAVKFGINTMSAALKFPFSIQQEWYLSQISLTLVLFQVMYFGCQAKVFRVWLVWFK